MSISRCGRKFPTAPWTCTPSPPGRPPAAAADAKPLQIGFSLTGGWDDAVFAPDALGLIRRSDAAAPLLPKDAPQN